MPTAAAMRHAKPAAKWSSHARCHRYREKATERKNSKSGRWKTLKKKLRKKRNCRSGMTSGPCRLAHRAPRKACGQPLVACSMSALSGSLRSLRSLRSLQSLRAQKLPLPAAMLAEGAARGPGRPQLGSSMSPPVVGNCSKSCGIDGTAENFRKKNFEKSARCWS